MSRTIRSKHTFSTSNNYHDDSWESMKHAPKWYRKCLNSKLRTISITWRCPYSSKTMLGSGEFNC